MIKIWGNMCGIGFSTYMKYYVVDTIINARERKMIYIKCGLLCQSVQLFISYVYSYNAWIMNFYQVMHSDKKPSDLNVKKSHLYRLTLSLFRFYFKVLIWEFSIKTVFSIARLAYSSEWMA